jgi:hypothetical protein
MLAHHQFFSLPPNPPLVCIARDRVASPGIVMKPKQASATFPQKTAGSAILMVARGLRTADNIRTGRALPSRSRPAGRTRYPRGGAVVTIGGAGEAVSAAVVGYSTCACDRGPR